MNRRRAYFESLFPGLRGTTWSIKSGRNSSYNCLAWAARETHRRWDFGPNDYWPVGVSKKYGIAYLVAAYTAEEFVVCRAEECKQYDPEFDTIVLYELGLEGAHAARLLRNGMWSSKLGCEEDIQHPMPESMSGKEYGNPLVYMKRRRSHGTRKHKKNVKPVG